MEMNRMRIMIATLVLSVLLWTSAQGVPQAGPPSIGTPAGSFFALLVPSTEESARWYHDYLGFTVVRKSDGPNGASRTIMLEQNCVLLEIIATRDSFALQQVTPKKPNTLQGIRKVGFVVDRETFDALYRGLQQKKATFVGDVFVDDGLKMRSFLIRDNNGNLVQFFSPVKS
jgi:catechol 2,3-dioxygenase-like lactoylglutathione lyase family enzyme